MSLKMRWITTAIVAIAQMVLGAHGFATLQADRHRPVMAAVGLTVVRETPTGAWRSVDLETEEVAAGDRIQVNLQTDQRLTVALLQWSEADGAARRLYPLPGEAADVLDPDVFYTLPSPSTWYEVSSVRAGDRLVLVAMSPRRAATLAPSLTTETLVDLARSTPMAETTGIAIGVDVPLPDGGVTRADLRQSRASDRLWVQWPLAP